VIQQTTKTPGGGRMRGHRFVIFAALFLFAVTGLLGIGVLIWLRSLLPPDGPALRGRLEANGLLPVFHQITTRTIGGQMLSPADARALDRAGVTWIHPIRSQGVIAAVQFGFGGADNHYGVIVVHPNASPPADAPFSSYVERWSDDTWFYSEIRPRGR
jgi:hypothetical protein